jgi:hypothetical protein
MARRRTGIESESAVIAAHADWSTHPAKRWMALARRAGAWRMEAPRLVGDTSALLPDLLRGGAPVVLGLDVPLGVPRGFARDRAEADFPAFVAGLVRDPGFFDVSPSLATVSPARPFYPARGIKGMTRAGHAAALGLADAQALSRLCDRATARRPAGAPVFWTLGANQSGKAAIAAWRDWIAPALAAGAPIALWPFAGGLHELLAPGRAVLAEVYPAEAMRQLGLKLAGSKRAEAPRRALAEPLRAAMARLGVMPEPALAAQITAGFGADTAGEDRLDCVLGLLAMIAVIEGAQPDFIPADPWITRWEGWVLGQTDLPKEAP